MWEVGWQGGWLVGVVGGGDAGCGRWWRCGLG